MNKSTVHSEHPRRWWYIVAALVTVAAAARLRPVAPVRAAFPGANGKIAFLSTRDDADHIYVMNADGSSQIRLTNSVGENDPAWSPDGTRIAFTNYRDDNLEIYTMFADGSGQTRLTNNNDIDQNPAWSPDGTKITFESNRDGNLEIYVMTSVGGTGQTRLTQTTTNDSEPAWSPDGSRIAFTSERDGNKEIYIMNADGSGQTRLTNNSAVDKEPVWSPDGSRIAFTSRRDGNEEIYLAFLGTSVFLRLTNNTSHDYYPAWSPDGTRIAFVSTRSGDNELYRMGTDGSAQTRLTFVNGADFEPDWQPVPLIDVSTTTAGTVGALAFGPNDILRWNGSAWSKAFDGTAAGLTPSGSARHDISAYWLDWVHRTAVMGFALNARVVPGVAARVDATDLVFWNGSAFSLWFDGQDVGLTDLKRERIDALHVLDGSRSPVGSNCVAYLLLSTTGAGKVPAPNGTTLAFRGEDVLGFCVTRTGENTTGLWTMVLDGSAEGMPAASLDSLSASLDGSILYLTTTGAFNVDSASGSHSMVYRYDFSTGQFSGPYFVAADEGLSQRVDALDVRGLLP